MDSTLEALCIAGYLILTLVPAAYGIHFYMLVYMAHRRHRAVSRAQAELIERYNRGTPDDRWPRVTTQIPLYNELAVARRVIEAAAAMDYPAGRHEIQVLDDSTDGTRAVVDRVCAELRAKGIDAKAIRRPRRTHYKAGALAYGLRSASGDFIAIFDADFIPARDFLRRMIPLIATQPDACCAQARWGHLNAEENWLTEGIALGIDGHFGVEQSARAWNGMLMNFNGTGGVWRRAAIEDPRVGGWSGDTITEDLDLSYRAQLAGWKIVYRRDEICPAEVPADVDAIKSQQRRWATGSIQTARKMIGPVWRSRLTLFQKIEATIHLIQYSIAIFMVLIPLLARFLVMALPIERYHAWLSWCWLPILFAAAAPSIAYVYARYTLGGGVSGPLRILKLMLLGLGLSVNNCYAVLVGLVQRGGEFVRTPKSGSTGRVRTEANYSAVRSNLWLIEVLFGTFCLAQWIYFLPEDRYIFGTFLLLYGLGLLALGWRSRPRVVVTPARHLPLTAPPLPATPEVVEPAAG